MITGIQVYNGGIVACHREHIFFSFGDGDWVQVNKDLSTLGSRSDLENAPTLPRSVANEYTFDEYTNGTADGRVDLMIHDESNVPAVLTVIGSNTLSAQYRYVELTGMGISSGGYGLVHNNQHIIAGDYNAPSSFYVSTILDMEDFSGTLSGQYSVADPITGIKSFRDILYIFCQNSIWKAEGLNTEAPSIQPVTRNIGCVSHQTIQEIGGDLIFLAPDGIRTLGATDRIDDVALNTASLPINSLIVEILEKRNLYRFTSCVLRDSSQYRLYYCDPFNPFGKRKGIIATYYPDETTGQTWSFSETLGIEVTAIHSGFINGVEYPVHGDTTGWVYEHNVGDTFNGENIEGTFQTPFFDLDDPGLRKTLHSVDVFIAPEGSSTVKMKLQHDYGSPYTAQPSFEYPLSGLVTASLIGDVVIGDFTIGSSGLPTNKIHVQGSGMNHAIRFRCYDESAPFTIQGYTLHLTTAGRI